MGGFGPIMVEKEILREQGVEADCASDRCVCKQRQSGIIRTNLSGSINPQIWPAKVSR